MLRCWEEQNSSRHHKKYYTNRETGISKWDDNS